MSIYAGVNIPFAADTQKFTEGMSRMRGEVGRLAAELNTKLSDEYNKLDGYQRRLNKGIGRMADEVTQFGQKLTMVSAAVAAATAVAFRYHAELDAVAKAFNVITENSQLTGKYLKDFATLARNPGLGFMEVSQAALRFMNLGDSIDVAKRKIKEIGNANALGGGGKEQFQTIMWQLSQMQSKGKILAEDLKPILSSSSVISKALNDRYGTVDSEQIAGKVQNTRQFISDLIDDLSKLGRAQDSAKNAWDNFTDALMMAGAGVGQFIDKNGLITDGLNMMSHALMGVSEWLASMPEGARKAVLGLGLIAVAAGPTVLLLGSMIKLGTSLEAVWLANIVAVRGLFATMLASPIMPVIIGFTALVLAIKAFKSNAEEAKTASQYMADAQKEVAAGVKTEADNLHRLLAIAKDEHKSKKDRHDAIKAINQINPEYLGNINLENVGLQKVNKQIELYIRLSELKARANNLQDKYNARRADLEALKKPDYMETLNRDLDSYFLGGEQAGKNAALRTKIKVQPIINDLIELKKSIGGVTAEAMKLEGSVLFGGNGINAGGGVKSGGANKSKAETDAEWRRRIEERAREIKNAYTIDPSQSYLAAKGATALNSNMADMPGIEVLGPNISDEQKQRDFIKSKFGVDDEYLDQYASSITGAFENLTRNTATGFASFIGEFMAGNMKLKDAGMVLRSLLGQTMKDLGQAWIAQGAASVTGGEIEKTLTNYPIGGGIALIGAGAGLVAVGTALTARREGVNSAYAGGYGASSISNNTPTMASTGLRGSTGSAGSPLQIDLNLSGAFTIKGDDLMYIVNKKLKLQPRI